MRKAYGIILSVILLAGIWACEQKPAAVVNGEPITEEQLQQKLQESVQQHGAEGAQVGSASLRAAVLEQLISETLLMQGALEAGVNVSDDEVIERMNSIRARVGDESLKKQIADLGLTEAEYLKLLRERMLKDKFVTSLVEAEPLTDEQLKEFYQNSPKPFIRPAEVQIRFIQFSRMEQAEQAMKAIQDKKEKFDAMADRLGESEEAITSVYAWVSPALFGEEIRIALEEAKKGSVAGPFQGRGGIYIFRLTDRHDERMKSFEEAKEEIRTLLINERKASTLIHWVASKRKSAVITVN